MNNVMNNGKSVSALHNKIQMKKKRPRKQKRSVKNRRSVVSNRDRSVEDNVRVVEWDSANVLPQVNGDVEVSLDLPSQQNVPSPFSVPDSAESCFEWLIHPITPKQFFSEIWEKKPLLLKKRTTDYYQGLLSCGEIDKILKKNLILFGKHLDVTSYVNGVRETHNPAGRAYPAVIWDYFQNGCSIRMLSPQTHSENLWKVNSLLQTFFGSFVGANAYLTPKGTQGFAPHYDDIEAFILQLEGKKHWKVYPPKNPNEELPRFSSPNFTENEIGQPILSVVLEPGDLLYFPRGFIHQAKSSPEVHSLHVTLSTYQKTTWGDLLERVVPQALNNALQEDVDFRKALPIGYLKYMGVAHNDIESEPRNAFLFKVRQLFEKLLQHLPVDAAADQMGKQFVNDSLPHKLNKTERMRSIHGNGDHWENGDIQNKAALELNTKVRLINPTSVKLVMEEEEVRLYHSFENTRIYQEVEPQYIEIGAELAPAVEELMHSWPAYSQINRFPLTTQDDKLEIANLLYDKGLLMTMKPLPNVD